jgi:hypothetical protein
VSNRKTIVAVFFVVASVLYAQSSEVWYSEMPTQAILSSDGKLMRIGEKDYHVYNAFDPIAPKGGERVIDFAGTLDYYMWMHKKPDKTFTISKIDPDLNIYYFDETTGNYTNPKGLILDD